MKDNYLNNLDIFKQVEKGNLQFNKKLISMILWLKDNTCWRS